MEEEIPVIRHTIYTQTVTEDSMRAVAKQATDEQNRYAPPETRGRRPYEKGKSKSLWEGVAYSQGMGMKRGVLKTKQEDFTGAFKVTGELPEDPAEVGQILCDAVYKLGHDCLSKYSDAEFIKSGSTLIWTLIRKKDDHFEIYTANVGDCRADLVEDAKVFYPKVTQLSCTHNTNIEAERERVRQEGGQLKQTGCLHPYRLAGLTPTRVIGDFVRYWHEDSQGLTFEPDISFRTTANKKAHVMLASDGITEYVKLLKLRTIFKELLADDNKTAEEKAERIRKQAESNLTHDNHTVLLAELNKMQDSETISLWLADGHGNDCVARFISEKIELTLLQVMKGKNEKLREELKPHSYYDAPEEAKATYQLLISYELELNDTLDKSEEIADEFTPLFNSNNKGSIQAQDDEDDRTNYCCWRKT